ncbi:CvpA family protein [Calditerrivibrio sp.]|uniref:CvpA family protein n=1 Tax=Calditerrivibrio sp. TaxID=2792612 RepID=UPI003D0B50B2
MYFSGWDTFFLIILLVFTIKGFLRGLIWEIFRILGIILSYLFSFQINPFSMKVLEFFGFSPAMAKLFGFVLTFLIIFVLVITASYLTKKFFRAIKLGWIDKTGGALFGLLKSAVIMSILLSFVVSISPSSSFTRQLLSSPVSSRIIAMNPYIYEMLNKITGKSFSNPFLKNGKNIL